ncbi:MAG: Phenylalanine--tRNA ligase beta subunit, partial [Patescibacteria group bacterium]|nr:Phenylalanine--tRNA ligase beta subunit [Patescibacteria group bacterium]
ILFDIGQPMHIFDADKVTGAISVRLAKEGESMTTLDGKVLELSHEDLIIADEKNVLALAGVKGGKIAEVDDGTTNIIIESANFDPKMVRRSATSHGIRTDAVKRFENNLSPMFAGLGLNSISLHILDLLPEAKFGPITDEYESPQVEKTINIDIDYIQKRLGLKIADTDILDIFKRLLFKPQQTGSSIVVVVPLYRLDIDEPDTLVEEVGRLYGYDKIPSVLPNKNSYDNDSKNFLAAQKLREVLFGLGFSEIYGYTFSATGPVELANPLASDRPFLRTNLSNSIKEKIALNLKSVLFDTDTVAIFDIGTVFDDEKENINVAIGIGNTKSKFHTNNKTIDLVISKIKEVFLVDVSPFVIKGELETIMEFPLNLLSEVSNEVEINLHDFIKDSVAYEPVSLYPRIIRDIALFVPKDTVVDIVMETIKNKAGNWLTIGPVLFDEFTKEGDVKTSLAFRLVFQAKDKTLEDKEINEVMAGVYEELKNQGWEVR